MGNTSDMPTIPPALACASQGSLNMIAGLNPNACVSALNSLPPAFEVWPIRVWLPERLCRYASSCARGVPVAGGVTTGGSTTGGGATEVPPLTVKPWAPEA